MTISRLFTMALSLSALIGFAGFAAITSTEWRDSTGENIWGGDCDICNLNAVGVNCYFDQGEIIKCFPPGGEPGSTCVHIKCELLGDPPDPTDNDFQCPVHQTYEHYPNGTKFRRDAGESSGLEVGPCVDDSLEFCGCKADVSPGGASEVIETEYACWRVVRCRTERGKCEKDSGGTRFCTNKSIGPEDLQADVIPDVHGFPCPTQTVIDNKIAECEDNATGN